MAGRGAGYALLGLAGLLLAIAVVSGWSGASRLSGREDGARAVQEVAAAFVTAYGTFDFRDEGDYGARLTALSTGELLVALTGASVDPAAARMQRSMTTRIDSVAVTALSEAEATATVAALQERRWVDPVVGASLHEQVSQRVVCRLVLEDGQWLVAELRLLTEEPVRLEAR